MLGDCIEKVRERAPLIHNITNFVTVNDVANIILASGANPIMSIEPEDIHEITAKTDALNINMGTLRKDTVDGMLKAGRTSNELGHPVLLDPVGVGASSLRIRTAIALMSQVDFAVIRGNISEIKTLAIESERVRNWDPLSKSQRQKPEGSRKGYVDAVGSGSARGVDADLADRLSPDNLDQVIEFLKAFSERTGAVVAVTGAVDLVCDKDTCYVIHNGRPEMGRITGTGCQLSGLMTGFLAANPGNYLEAAAAAVCTMGLAGEIGWSRMQEGDGNATYRNRIIDAVYHMNKETLDKGAKYELR